MSNVRNESMIRTLITLKGNARACIWTEPLWGIPYQLCVPYAILYMQQLGLSLTEIGMIGSLTLLVSIVSSVLSGVLTDKLGRKRCTLIFDTLAWSVPELLWAFSQNFGWFVIAALFNGMKDVTVNSWGLLLVEDSDDELVLRCFSLAGLMGMVAAFVAPVSKLAVDVFGVVPTMRVTYFITFVMMTTKFIVLNYMVHETTVGKQRMKDTANESILKVLLGCKDVLVRLLKEKRMVLTIAVNAVFKVISTLNTYFWAPFITSQAGIPDGDVVLFTTLKSIVQLACLLVLLPRVRFAQFKRPTLISWTLFGVSQVLLLMSAPGPLVWITLGLSTVFEGISLSVLTPMIDSMLFINAEPNERARILGLVFGTITTLALVFPMIAGSLAEYMQSAPFLINLVMLALGIWLTVKLAKAPKPQEGQ